jgi:hypothetical protein
MMQLEKPLFGNNHHPDSGKTLKWMLKPIGASVRRKVYAFLIVSSLRYVSVTKGNSSNFPVEKPADTTITT